MSAAVLAWAASMSLLCAGLFYGLQHARLALIAACVILFVHLHARPFLFFIGVDEPWPPAYFGGNSWQLMAQANLLSALWLICFLTGYVVSRGPARAAAPLLPDVQIRLNLPLIALAAGVFTLASGLASLYLISRYGSVEAFVFAVKIQKDMAGLYVFREISVIGAVVAALGFLFSQKKSKFGASALFFTLLIFSNCAIMYLWGNRYNMSLILIALGLGYHFYIRKFKIHEICILVLIVLAGLQILRHVRFDMIEVVLSRSFDRGMTFWQDFSTALHLSQYDAFMLAIRDARDKFDYRAGQDFWNGLLAVIPRQIMPDRETFHIGGWFRQIYQPHVINGWPVSIVGSWYVNFGLIGIVIGGIVSGGLARIFDTAYYNARGSAWHAAIGAGLCLFVVRSGIEPGTPQAILLYLVPIAGLAMALNYAGHYSKKYKQKAFN